MRRIRLGALAAGALALSTAAALAETHGTIGEASCAEWLAEKNVPSAASRLARLNDLSWALGYVSRAATTHPDDILRRTDRDSIALYIDDYCTANPGDGLSQAAANVEKILADRSKPRG